MRDKGFPLVGRLAQFRSTPLDEILVAQIRCARPIPTPCQDIDPSNQRQFTILGVERHGLDHWAAPCRLAAQRPEKLLEPSQVVVRRCRVASDAAFGSGQQQAIEQESGFGIRILVQELVARGVEMHAQQVGFLLHEPVPAVAALASVCTSRGSPSRQCVTHPAPIPDLLPPAARGPAPKVPSRRTLPAHRPIARGIGRCCVASPTARGLCRYAARATTIDGHRERDARRYPAVREVGDQERRAIREIADCPVQAWFLTDHERQEPVQSFDIGIGGDWAGPASSTSGSGGVAATTAMSSSRATQCRLSAARHRHPRPRSPVFGGSGSGSGALVTTARSTSAGRGAGPPRLRHRCIGIGIGIGERRRRLLGSKRGLVGDGLHRPDTGMTCV